MPGQRARRAHLGPLGQHFLASPALAATLVRDAGIAPTDLVVDVGAGTGLLTEQLARRARRVEAVELDPRLAHRLARRYAGDQRVCVIEADALRRRWPREPFRVVANPPFGGITSLLRHLLDDPRVPLERADLVVQAGVAVERARGVDLLTLSWAPWYRFGVGRRLPPSAFRPPPRARAAVLVVERRRRPLLPTSERKAWVAHLRRGFSHNGGGRRSLEQWLRRFGVPSGPC